jgi:hypothetical protein
LAVVLKPVDAIMDSCARREAWICIGHSTLAEEIVWC